MLFDGATELRVSDPGIRDLFSRESRWQAWLDVESALASAEAKVGVIPDEAAVEIAKNATVDRLDRARIDEGLKRTAHALVPLVWELSRVCGSDSGRWVHWGATTENILQTGDTLLVRRANTEIKALLRRCLEAMAGLASTGADMVMAGRSHGQHAVPITFGFKVAVWIDELSRHVARIRSVEDRLFVGMLGGAVGTFASLGDNGPAVQDAMCDVLELSPMRVPARSVHDHRAEYLCVLGLLAATGGKIAREIYSLMETEVGELEEPMPPGTVGSSTMPQKRNPHLCQDVIAGAAEIRSLVPLGLEAMAVEHEADRSRSLVFADALERACVGVGDLLVRLAVILEGLSVDPERMRRNLDVSHGLILSEAIMLRLGEHVGRQRAHDLVYEAAQECATTGADFKSALMKVGELTRYISTEDLDDLFDPTAYVGESPRIARSAVDQVQAMFSQGSE
ncbi:class-II fumarase/aspartase family protein [Flexivirga oryzae]|uniref:Adenylosuccinate lyase n=1 Tax=Flexivirga oryzae TaxID=1794944 RepID=A0A839N797_9MICO|nr:adenylosuccinate lyase family protein [Flexivirga oryzae]MBB2891894.1 adenylosuccinate lyase [Flexivirga oryzae]